jgi:hypothetical protein
LCGDSTHTTPGGSSTYIEFVCHTFDELRVESAKVLPQGFYKNFFWTPAICARLAIGLISALPAECSK